ncbi:hypothetical protein JXA02_11700 [candidate division KSB1 bacterium]|nr:hypothetical protein [candidate division KSB1 bacterium]RQW02214.1 MAG: hypothetical protein EH222_13980 [candidate division KSB1 bacterium]
MKKIHLFHFNKEEIAARSEQIESFGYSVDSNLPSGADFFKRFKEKPPNGIVIDLSRSPSQGRDIGIYMRHSKATRFIPLLFVDGAPDKILKVKEQLPDAVFTAWDSLKSDLKYALADPPANLVVPESTMAGYAGTPLLKKLGIRGGMAVGLVHAPDGFRSVLQCPANVRLIDGATKEATLLLWFLHSLQQLDDELQEMVEHAAHARIWMIWPKKTSPLAADLTQQLVRERGLSVGLVDYKVCSVDETWSGLLFTKKRG